ncbi:MAG: winged helix-turn-helix domain-containing protein [Promethearchaeota archaeon]
MDSIKLLALGPPEKILYVIKEREGSYFTRIIEDSKLSRNTVNKYLKELLNKGYIKKVLIEDEFKKQRIGYMITELGRQYLSTEEMVIDKDNWLSSLQDRNEGIDLKFKNHLIDQKTYNKQKSYLGKIDDMFFNLLNNIADILGYGGEELGDINEIIAQMGNFTSKLGERFFNLEPSYYLYLAIIFIFFNSLENPQFNISEDLFIEIYGVSEPNLKFAAKKQKLSKFRQKLKQLLGKANIGYEEELELLFKRKLEAIKDKNIPDTASNALYMLIDKLIYLITNKTQLVDNAENNKVPIPKKSLLKLKKFFENYENSFAEYYKIKQKISRQLNKTIDLIVNSNFGLNRFYANFGFSGNRIMQKPYFFHNKDSVGVFLNSRIKDAMNTQFINMRIFEIKKIRSFSEIAESIANEMEIMHLIWTEIKGKLIDLILEKLYKKASIMRLRTQFESEKQIDFNLIRGFCPTCGERILYDSVECEFCKTKFYEKEPIYDIRKAKKIAMEFKNMQYDEPSTKWIIFTKCNKCGTTVGKTWKMCPTCKTKLKNR